MSARRFDVVGLGQCCLDVLATVESYPAADAKCEYLDRVIQGGGPVGTALVALTRWGLSTAAIGVVGDDEFGPMIRRSLDDDGVDTQGLVTRGGGTSQFAFIAAEPGAGTRTVFWRRPTGEPLRADEINHDTIRGARAFHTDGLLIDAAMEGARVARDAGVPVVVDAGTLRDGMLDLARLSDAFVVSEKFGRQLVADDDPISACRRLAEMGPRVVGVTLGARGYVAMIDGKIAKHPAYSADVVDTTGCGDVFHAGITYGVVQGWDAQRSLDFGAWVAARVSERLGGRTGIPSPTAYPGPK
jgi:ribokinase